jgi:phage FluMu gp28-like protein
VNKLSPQLVFLVEYLNLPEAAGDPDARWEKFQLQHLNNQSLLAIELKSRQVGWSWLAAAESVANAHLHKGSTSVFISINLNEAQEKIRYANAIHASLDNDIRRRKIIDNRFEIEYDNGSRIISHPCRPVRGKAKVNLYLDEFAHYPNDAEIYQSALPVISKGGVIRIGSSPLGARGRFWEIFTQSVQVYPGYRRRTIPWWTVDSFCIDTSTAKKLAPLMDTHERVMAFGTQRLIQIFQNSPLDDFQQEYECAWLDETISWIDWELIKRNQTLALQQKLWYRMANGVDDAFYAIDEVAGAITSGRVEDALVAGMDVGRRKDKSEIVVLGLNSLNQLPFRLNLSLDRVEFDDQQKVAERLLDTLPVASMLVDETGMGMHLAENLHTLYGPRCQGASFSNASKQIWAVEAKLRAQRGETPLPLERDLTYQIHSVKKKVSLGSSSLIFENDATDPHHADKFWAWALAINAGNTSYVAQTLVTTDNPLKDFRG